MNILIIIIEAIFGLMLFINAALFIPQAYRIYKIKHSKGISLVTFAGFLVIQFFTILHGIIQHDMILIIGTIISFCTCSSVIIFALFYRARTNHLIKNNF